jgi:hypothetical protein
VPEGDPTSVSSKQGLLGELNVSSSLNGDHIESDHPGCNRLILCRLYHPFYGHHRDRIHCGHFLSDVCSSQSNRFLSDARVTGKNVRIYLY